MPYLYSPPQWQQHQVVAGALRYRVTTSTTVYRIGGVWTNALSPGMSAPDPKTCDIDTATGLRLYFNKPMVVPDNLYAELLALQPADPSWSAGSLTLL